MKIGYARVSTTEQNLDAQLDALRAAGVEPDRIYTDKISSRKQERPGLENALRALREGDTLVVLKLDRLARSLRDLIGITDRLGKSGANLVVLTQGAVDTTTPMGRAFFGIMGVIAEFERDIIAERTREGIAAAKRRGRRGGRPPAMSPDDIKMAKLLLADPDITIAAVAEKLGVSQATIYKHLPGGRSGLEQ